MCKQHFFCRIAKVNWWGHFSAYPEVSISFSQAIGLDYTIIILLWKGRQSSAQQACYFPSLNRYPFIHLAREDLEQVRVKCIAQHATHTGFELTTSGSYESGAFFFFFFFFLCDELTLCFVKFEMGIWQTHVQLIILLRFFKL